MKMPEVVFSVKAIDGGMEFRNEQHLEFYLKEHDGEDLLCYLKPISKNSEKLKLYAYYHVCILKCAVIGYTNVGYSGVDEIHADYLLRAEFAKSFVVGPKGEYVPVILDKRNMTKARLLKLVQDCIFFIENDLDVIVPDSQEWKARKMSGRKFKKVENLEK